MSASILILFDRPVSDLKRNTLCEFEVDDGEGGVEVWATFSLTSS